MRSSIVMLLVGALACGGDDDGSVDASVADGGVDGGADASEPLPPQPVGGPCAEDVDCQAGLECLLGAPEAAAGWEGGYCTRPCEIDPDCPDGSRCGPAWFGDEGAALHCLAECEREVDGRGGCRDLYTCAFDGVCIPGCRMDSDCDIDPFEPSPGPRNRTATCELETGRCLGADEGAGFGEPCIVNQDCAGPGARCFLGTCASVSCDLGGAWACAGEAVCFAFQIPFDLLAGMCGQPCEPGVDGTNGVNPDDVCPEGYWCVPAEQDLFENGTGYCSPYREWDPNPDGALPGEPCASVADCQNPHGFTQCTEGECTRFFCDVEPFRDDEDWCPAPARCTTIEPMGVEPELGRWGTRYAELGYCR